MEQEERPKRIRDRIKLTLPMRVTCRESRSYKWVEATRLLDITQFGAGFTLKRVTEPGRLLLLTLPMPRQLRCFDHAELQYSVWALVRHFSVLPETTVEGGTIYRGGVAFLGKRPPRSFETHPATRYEPLDPGSVKAELWQVCETKTGGGQQSVVRSETRLMVPVEVFVQVYDESGKVFKEEHTVTENISSRGASIPTGLDVEVGRFLRITSERDKVSLFAAVRSLRVAPDGITRLGLEFLHQRWPI